MDRGGGSGKACYYSVLEIAKDASFSDVRAAYRKLAMVSVRICSILLRCRLDH